MARFMNVNFRRPKQYRPLNNHMDWMDDIDLYKRYRFDRDGIDYIVSLVRDDLEPETGRSRALSTELQVLAALRYVSGDSLQIDVGGTLGLSQQTVSNCVDRVTASLCRQANRFIYFPTDEEGKRQIHHGFFEKRGFPGVIGLIDGVHIPILGPKREVEREYYNRKRVHTINVQAVVDHKFRFLNVVARWPGSCHDSFILRNSNVWDAFETGGMTGLILGDAGYPNRPWLMTPFAAPTTDAQRRYNRAQTGTRVGVEQTFGRWKRRFYSLHKELRVATAKAPQVIVACAVLHNIAIDRNLPDIFNDLDADNIQPDLAPYGGGLNTGDAYRNEIVQNFFTR